MSRRDLVTLLVVTLVVLSGCIGSELPAGVDASDGQGSDGDDGAGAESGGDASDDDTARTGDSAWDRFAFEEGEFYRFRVDDVANERSSTITWDVVGVDGAQVTADVTFDDGNTSFTRTVSGTNATILWDLRQVDHTSAEAEAAVQSAGYLTLGPFNAMTAYYAHRDLVVGDNWRLSGSDAVGYMTANVEGRSEYAGVACYETAIRIPDGDAWGEDAYEFESCIAPDASLAIRTAYYDGATGDLRAEIVLEEYRHG